MHFARSYPIDSQGDAALLPELSPAEYRRRARELGPGNPLLRSIEVDACEALPDPEGHADPTGEALLSPVPFVLRKHANRALILVSARCFVHCRFCFRKGQMTRFRDAPGPTEWRCILRWLSGHPEVEEVILSGGDPLTLPDRDLAEIASHLAALPHLRRWRIHTRAPVVEPGRVTPSLLRAMGSDLPLRVVVHLNHPAEFSRGAGKAVSALHTAAAEVACQSVLLRGVNDEPDVLVDLLRVLENADIVPHYLHHPDRAIGNRHFRVSIRHGLSLYRSVTRDAGLAGLGHRVPPYVLDLPNGCGKCPVSSLRPVCTESTTGRRRQRYRWCRPQAWDSQVQEACCEWWDIWEPCGRESGTLEAPHAPSATP